MYKVAFVIRDIDSYAYEEEKQEFCFVSEEDAYTFYEDLENFVDEASGGGSYVDSKSKPEKVRDVLYKYNKEMKRLQQV